MVVQTNGWYNMPETTDLNTLVNMVHLSTVSVKPDGDATTSKKLTIRTTFTNVPFRDIVIDAIRTDNIRLQRDLRKLFDTLDTDVTWERVYNAKPSTHITEEMARSVYVTNLRNMTPEQRDAEFAKLSDDAQNIINETTE